MENRSVNFRGDGSGITITVVKGNYEDVIEEIENRILSSRDFFKGATLKEISSKHLKESDIRKIESILEKKYDIIISEDKNFEEEKPPILKNIPKEKQEETEKEGYFVGIEEGNSKFIRNTIRSGQLLKFNGNVVIVGDVNPGGVVSATGNIVVLGTLKGIAKAGVDGNRDAFIAAFRLEPTQLKIAEIITRKPDEDFERSQLPEIAKIQDEMIVIESYLNRNTKK